MAAAAMARRLKRMRNITIACSRSVRTMWMRNRPGSIKAAGQCRFWRSSARIRGGELTAKCPDSRRFQPPNLKRFHCGGIVAGAADQPVLPKAAPEGRRGSHRLVIRPAAAFGWNPSDIAVGILDIAGFAVNAVLGIDLEARPARLLDPFIDAGRTIARRRTGI